METNYTLKKLIRGGTALLFLLAFMLTGTFSAVADQLRQPYNLELKIEGVGVVEISAANFYQGEVENDDPDNPLNYPLGDINKGTVVYFNTDPGTCYEFDRWESSTGVIPEFGPWSPSVGDFDYRWTMPGEEVDLTAIFILTPPEFTATENDADGCINEEITPIVFGITQVLDEDDFTLEWSNGDGIGLTGDYSPTDGTYTIAGAPDTFGTFTYVLTIDNDCGTDSETGTITVYPTPSITLSPQSAGELDQTICVNNDMAEIRFLIEAADLSNFTLEWTPVPSSHGSSSTLTDFAGEYALTASFNTHGSYTYVLSYEDECGTAYATGTITVLPDANIALTSAAATADQEVCLNETIDPIVYAITGTYSSVTVNGLPNGVDGVYTNGEFVISGAVAEVGTFNFDILVEGDCEGAEIDGTIIVNPLPVAEIYDAPDVCYDDLQILELHPYDHFGADFTATWTYGVVGSGQVTEVVVTNSVHLEIPANEDYIPGLDKYVTSDVYVTVVIENELGCFNEGIISFTFTVLEIPHVVDNVIQTPQIDQNFKYIFCEMIPKETVTIHGIGVPVASQYCDPDPDTAIELRWRVRHYANGVWSNWITAPGISNNESYLLPEWNRTMYPGLEMVQYRRQARAVGCDCADNENGTTAWADGNSNVVTLYVVDHIVAEILEAGPVCHDDNMPIEGNLLSVPVMDDEGEPTGDYFTYVTGLWTTEAEELTFGLAPNLAVNTLIAEEPGKYVNAINWALTPVPVVYAECSSDNPLYCCSGDDIDATVIFEELTVPQIEELPDVVCLGNTMITLPYVETASGEHPTVTVDVWRDGEHIIVNAPATYSAVTGEFTYNLLQTHNGGSFVVYFTVELNECEEIRFRSFERIPHFVVASSSYHCYEEGVAHEIDYTANEDDRYILQYQYRVNPVTATNPPFSDWEDAIDAEGLPKFEDPAVYQVRLRYRTEEPIVCNGPHTQINLEVLPNITDIAFVGEACYDEVIEIEVTHSIGVTSMDLSIVGATIPEYSSVPWEITGIPVNPNHTKTKVSFAPEELLPGVHEFTATVYRQLPFGTEMCEFTFTQELTVKPPVYAVFSPNYRKDESGDLIYIEDVPNVPAQGFINGTPYVLNVPVSIVNDGGLYIDFSAEVADVIGDPLSGEDQGEFVILQKNVDGTWTNVDVKVTYANPGLTPGAGYQAANRAVVRPYDFVNQKFLELEFDTEYRLMHNNVYKTSCGEGLVEYRLSKIDEDGEYVYNEINSLAYSKVPYTDDLGANKVYFKTFSIAYANLPSVFPIGDDGRCDTLVVEFKNPVRYRANQFITPDGSQFKYKFELEKKAFGSSIWVTEDIIDYVQPENFETVVGDVAGPTRMVIHLNPGVELDYGADYRIRMVPSNVNNEVVYGFWDLVLGVPVLDKEYDFDTYNNGIGTGWHWSASQYYPVVFDVLPWPKDWYGTPDAAATTSNNITFTNAFDNLVDAVWNPVTEEWELQKQDDPYHVDFYGGNFTVSAQPGEGYRFMRWRRSYDGGNTFTPGTGLPTSGPWWQTEGYHYFPQSFTWRPDTFLIRTSSTAPLNTKAWIHAECDDELVYRAEFEKNRYTVRSWPVHEDNQLATNNALGVVTTIGGDFNREHGSTVRIEATPNPGYYFVGWRLAELPSSIANTADFVYTPPVHPFLMDPTDHTAVLDIDLLGPFTHGQTFTVRAIFAEFNPKIHAAAQGIKYDGDVDPNITNIQISIIHVAQNQLDSGQDDAGVFPYDDYNFYEWLQIKYGNPTYPPPSVNWPVTLVPLDVDCEYEFDKWERFDSTVIGEDGDGPIYIGWREIDPEEDNITINEVDPSLIQFIPLENYRLRAQFVWREDVDVDVVVYENDTYSYGGGHEVEYGDASIEVKFMGPREDGTRVDGSRDRWFNGVPDPNNVFFTDNLSETEFWPHDLLEITVYPKSNYYTYYWIDQEGNEVVSDECALPQVSSITLIDRGESSGGTPDQSTWHYTVGCDNITLRAVMKLKRFEVGITATDMNGTPVLTNFAQQGRFTGVTPLYSIAQRKFNCDLGYVSGNPSRRGLGFVRTSGSATLPAAYRGYFEKFVDGQNTYSSFQATAVGLYNSPANDQVWVFHDWQELQGGIWVTIQEEDYPTLEIDEIASKREFRARFRNSYVEPTYTLTVTDDIPDYTAPYTYSATWPAVHPEYYAWQSSPLFKRNVVTLEKGFVAGWNFQNWVLEEGIALVAPITGNPNQTTNPTLGGDYFRFPDLWDFEEFYLAEINEDATDDEIIEAFLKQEELKFKMPANDVTIKAHYLIHQYTVIPVIRTHKTPHTAACLTIDNFVGGDVTPAEGILSTYNTVVNFEAVASEGFTMVNWMFGDVNDCEGEEGPCAANNALTGWQLNPFDSSPGAPDDVVDLDFRVPRLDQRYHDPIYVYAIFAETPHNDPYPYYTLEAKTASYDDTVGPWLKDGKDGVAAVHKFGADYNDSPEDVWFTWSTEPNATYAHGNMAKVWVKEEDIKPGYEFVQWDTNTVTYVDEYNHMIAYVCMDADKEPTALFRAITYDLNIYANGYNQFVGDGHVAFHDNIPGLSDHTTYTVEDPKIRVFAEAIEDDGTYDYYLVGIYYDWYYVNPVIDDGGQELVWPAGTLDYEFYFSTVIPNTLGQGFDREVTMFARFIRVPKGYQINLITKGISSEEPPLIVEYEPELLAGVELTKSPDKPSYDFEDPITVTAGETPWGFLFKHWKYIDGSEILPPQKTFNHIVEEDTTFVAVFKALDYTVKVEATDGGTAFVDDEEEAVYNRLMADKPNVAVASEWVGWEFSHWTSDPEGQVTGSDAAHSFDYEVTAAVFEELPYEVVFTANFIRSVFTLSVDIVGEGEVNGNDSAFTEDVEFEGDALAFLDVEPAGGWEFAMWTEDGEEVDLDVLFADGMPARDVDLVAHFVTQEHTLTYGIAPVETAGTVVGTAPGVQNFGDPIELTAVANDAYGWEFDMWTVEFGTLPAGVDLTEETIAFDMPAGALMLIANFKEVTYVVEGQVRFFGPNQYLVPNNAVHIDIADEAPQYNRAELKNGIIVNSYFEFERGVAQEYHVTLMIDEDDLPLYRETSTGPRLKGVGSADALAAAFMLAGADLGSDLFDPSAHWIGAPIVEDDKDNAVGPFVYAPFAEAVRSELDPLRIIYRSLGTFGYPEGVYDLQAGANVGNPLPGAGPANTFDVAYADGIYTFTGVVDAGAWNPDQGKVYIYLAVTGDLNLSFNPTSDTKTSDATINQDNVIDAEIGEIIDIPVTVKAGAEIGAATLGLGYRSDLIEILNVNMANNILGDEVLIGWIGNDNTVIITATVLSDISVNDQLFYATDFTEIVASNTRIIDDFELISVAVTTEGVVDVPQIGDGEFVVNNFPNPFNTNTTIEFSLPEAAEVKVVVMNQMGQVVETLVNEKLNSGTHSVEFYRGSHAPGIYFYNIVAVGQANTYSKTNSMIIVQ